MADPLLPTPIALCTGPHFTRCIMYNAPGWSFLKHVSTFGARKSCAPYSILHSNPLYTVKVYGLLADRGRKDRVNANSFCFVVSAWAVDPFLILSWKEELQLLPGLRSCLSKKMVIAGLTSSSGRTGVLASLRLLWKRSQTMT